MRNQKQKGFTPYEEELIFIDLSSHQSKFSWKDDECRIYYNETSPSYYLTFNSKISSIIKQKGMTHFRLAVDPTTKAASFRFCSEETPRSVPVRYSNRKVTIRSKKLILWIMENLKKGSKDIIHITNNISQIENQVVLNVIS